MIIGTLNELIFLWKNKIYNKIYEEFFLKSIIK